MSVISEDLSKTKFAFDEKFVKNPGLPVQKKKALKRKIESEPVCRPKKIRRDKKVGKYDVKRKQILTIAIERRPRKNRVFRVLGYSFCSPYDVKSNQKIF